MSRPHLDFTMLIIAGALSERSTCIKRAVGCVLADKHGRIISTGYNGVAAGMAHCNEQIKLAPMTDGERSESWRQWPNACNYGQPFPSGADLCEAVHAESNALLQCHDADKIYSCYTTWSPCFRCVKELLNTGCKRIVFHQDTAEQPQAKQVWIKAGRQWLTHGMHMPAQAATALRHSA